MISRRRDGKFKTRVQNPVAISKLRRFFYYFSFFLTPKDEGDLLLHTNGSPLRPGHDDFATRIVFLCVGFHSPHSHPPLLLRSRPSQPSTLPELQRLLRGVCKLGLELLLVPERSRDRLGRQLWPIGWGDVWVCNVWTGSSQCGVSGDGQFER